MGIFSYCMMKVSNGMKLHIKEKRRKYMQLFNRAKKLGVSWADFRYYTVYDANEAMHLLELEGQKSDWGDECLEAAERFVYMGEQAKAEKEMELEYEQSFENGVEDYGPSYMEAMARDYYER
jgi:hypothetical protein